MGLRNITIHRTTVEYHGQPIAVRGISISDIMVAAQDYGPQMALMFGKVTSGQTDGADVKKTIMALAKEAPDMAGAIIALASDDYSPEAVDLALQLPFNVQIELLEGVFHQTFYSEADVKKLIESLTKMITAVSGVLTQVNPSGLPTGIGDFAVKQAS